MNFEIFVLVIVSPSSDGDGYHHYEMEIYHIKFGHWTHAAYQNVCFDNRRNA